MKKQHIVVIGGGTGTYGVLRGLHEYSADCDLTAVVTMADSGGSTGRLRDEFGYLPVGDVRMALTALAQSDTEHEQLLRELFNYRFQKGEGLSGHNFGNLFLVVLTEILGSETAAIAAASKILGAAGSVVPITSVPVDLIAEYQNGDVVTGEHNIEEKVVDEQNAITRLRVTPEQVIFDEAVRAIQSADVIVIGPGDLYTSILANIVVPGAADALRSTTAKIIYVCNLMTKSGQTAGMTTDDHYNELTKYMTREPDVLLFNTAPIPKDLLAQYALEDEHPVLYEVQSRDNFVGVDLLAEELVINAAGDTMKRSFVRHDSAKLAKEIFQHIA